MSFIVANQDGGPQRNLSRVVGTGFPTEEFTATWNIWFTVNRDNFQTYFSLGPTTWTGGDDYQVCFDGNGVASLNFGLGSHGGDTYHASAAPTTGRWYRQAYRRRKIATNNYEQFFWIDLEFGVDKVSRAHLQALVWGAGNVLMYGSNAWSDGGEGINGKMRCLKIWSDAKSEADIQAESAVADIATAAGATNLWGRWPCVSDGNDVSGNGRHLSSVGTVTFDGEPSPSGAPTPNRNEAVAVAESVVQNLINMPHEWN